MKKAALIFLVCIYAISIFGFGVKQFYCCGRLKSITISLIQDANLKYSKDNEKRGCCDNKYQFFKVKDNHITADQVGSLVKCYIDLHPYTPLFREITFASQKISVSYRSNAPPLHTGVPLYIYNCIFRI